MTYLLDTSALIVLYRREPGWERIEALFLDPDNVILLSTLSIAEFGRKLKELGSESEAIFRLLDTYLPMFSDIVAVDAQVATSSLQLTAQVPERLPLVDSLIAATAELRSACLVHKDKHLAAIPDSLMKGMSLLV